MTQDRNRTAESRGQTLWPYFSVVRISFWCKWRSSVSRRPILF